MSHTKVTMLALVALSASMVIGAACRAADRAGTAAKQPASAIVAADSAAHAASGDTALERRADHARIEGSPSASLWVVEASDFQCPFCKDWHDETYATIKHDYVDTGKIRLAYINFPLSIHRNALQAAEAAMCVAAQGKFWPMHDSLFATQHRWEASAAPAATFDSLARSVGADEAAYHQCVTQHATRALIQADIDRATAAGVQSTPTFIIGGTMIVGAKPTEVFRQVIDSALAKTAAKTAAK